MDVSALDAIARHNGGLVTRRQARAAGVSDAALSRAARTGQIARVARGIYAPAGTAIDVADPRRATTSMRVVLSHRSAAAWWGVDMPAPVRRLHVTAPRSRSRRHDAVRGVRIHRAALTPSDVTHHHGVAVTTPLRTALDVARHASLEHAVAIVDAFLRKGLLTDEEFADAAARARGPGGRRARLVASLVDAGSGSVLESLARVLLWRHRLRPPVSQWNVRHPQLGWLGRVDFAWPQLQVAVECDGYEWHAGADSFQRDRRRWTTLTRAGWRCAVFTWWDVVGDTGHVVSTVKELLGAVAPQTPAHNRVA